jgi:hypothetical protein
MTGDNSVMAKALPSLAAALIVRDEARCIARCLDSVRPWVDRMIVVDTGSRDETAAIARSCGAQVHALEWPDDFAAARNHSLGLADADWTLVIDADEWIESGGEALRPWTLGPPRIGAICQLNSFDNGATEGLSRNWIPRLLPRGTRYQGRIHEQPVSPWPAVRIALELGHDGYRDAQAARKADRNTPLLLRDLRDRPNDAYTLFQLGKDAEARHDYGDASRWYARALPLTPQDANWMHALIVRHLHCLGQTGAAAQALDIAADAMARWSDSPDFFFVVGNLALDRAGQDPAHALTDWLPLALTAWERCLEIGERPDLEGSVAGRGGHLAQHNLDVIRRQLAVA